MEYSIARQKLSLDTSLNGGAHFRNPQRMEIEFLNSGAFQITLSHAKRDNAHGGWHTFNFQNGGEFGAGLGSGRFIIGFLNGNLHDLEVRGAVGTGICAWPTL